MRTMNSRKETFTEPECELIEFQYECILETINSGTKPIELPEQEL